MRIRGTCTRDLEIINDIWRKYHSDSFGLPDINNNAITHAVVTNGNDEVMGFGVVKVLAEAIMILELEESKEHRLEGLQLLMDEAIRACREAKISQLHVFVKDENLSRLLQRKYAFIPVKDQTLVLEI